MIELTDVSAVIPVLPLDKYRQGVLTMQVADEVTPTEFAKAIERLQQADFDTTVKWNWDSSRPTVRYQDGDVTVSIEGPVIRKPEAVVPDAEEVLLEAAVGS